MQPPQFPCGRFTALERYSEEDRSRWIEQIADAPAALQAATCALNDEQLNAKYKNWSIRQIAHHIADSHVHSYIRFKWTLTEDCPTIKAYQEADWVMLDDARLGAIEPSLQLLEGLHQKWSQLLNSMTKDQFFRTFDHPESGETTSLWTALNYYAWHSRHHTGQIRWLVENGLDS